MVDLRFIIGHVTKQIHQVLPQIWRIQKCSKPLPESEIVDNTVLSHFI